MRGINGFPRFIVARDDALHCIFSAVSDFTNVSHRGAKMRKLCRWKSLVHVAPCGLCGTYFAGKKKTSPLSSGYKSDGVCIYAWMQMAFDVGFNEETYKV